LRSEAKTADEYIAGLTDDRREQMSEVREVILKNLPKGIEENMNWGMIAYEIPLSTYPDTYNGQPLMYAALASQKNYMAVYLTNVYGNPKLEEWFLAEYKKTGKKLDMGKSCVRFKTIDDLPLELIGKTIAKTTPEDMIDVFEKIKEDRKKK